MSCYSNSEMSSNESLSYAVQSSIVYNTTIQTEEPAELPVALTHDILLVNESHLLPSVYEPEDLINIYEQAENNFLLARSDIYICKSVYKAMNEMFAAASADGLNGYVVTSGYRNYERQTEIYNTTADGSAQKPGASEHQTGLAFDVTVIDAVDFSSTLHYQWLIKNCAEYGFILRYPQNGVSKTGIPYEPWHYRYVGTPYSQEIMGSGMTLEEYLIT